MASAPFVSFLDGHDPNEHIVLPRQSPLGTFAGLGDQPTGVWPITLLCLQHAHMFVRSSDKVQFGAVPELGHKKESTDLWVIECECAQGNCGRKKTIFAFGDGPRTDDQIRKRLLTAHTHSPIACIGHEFLIDIGLVKVKPLEKY